MTVRFIKDYEKPHRPGKYIKAGTVTGMSAERAAELKEYIEIILTIDKPQFNINEEEE